MGKTTPSWDAYLDRYDTQDSKKKDVEVAVQGFDRATRQRFPIQERIDLHGMKLDEAILALKGFLSHSRAQGLKKVVIVHGKGHHSIQKSVLGPAVRAFLQHESSVSDFDYCPREEGGRGATWVWFNVRGK